MSVQARNEVSGISVVMPVRNAASYIEAAVSSIIEQDFENWELLIVDDHCTDDSIAKVKNLNDSRIKILAATGHGLVNALNQGVDRAAYPLIARMDADDIAEPMRLSSQYRYWLSDPSINIVGAKVDVFHDSQPLGTGYKLYEQWINSLTCHEAISEQLFIESPIPHPTAMFSKPDFDHLGGYQDNGWPEDYDLWCRAWLVDMKFGKPNGPPLLRWRDYPKRTSRQNSAYSNQKFLQCKAFYIAEHLKKSTDHRRCSIWGAGPTGLQLHDYLHDCGISVTHFYDVNQKLRHAKKRNKLVKLITKNSVLAREPLAPPCLVAVSSRGARQKIEAFLLSNHWLKGRDFILAA